jgi:hypothetical protein
MALIERNGFDSLRIQFFQGHGQTDIIQSFFDNVVHEDLVQSIEIGEGM